ncbi:MAG: quinone-dependent dihydroorotate dehydrogenase [Bacteroidia bacterium]|nr:quinone-dependent dihydroorotate dehydrogenase [Bacteroidia bacterium]
MYRLLLKLLFLMPAETAHHFTMHSLKCIQQIPFVRQIFYKLFFVKNPVEFVGIRFPNRVGLAAGFDKNAKFLREFQSLGFGFVEIGTVTPLAQPGNDKPRLFRLIKDEAIINRMGFNNDGVDAIVNRLKNRPNGLIVGGNIGKNKVTPNELAQRDYEICFEKLYNHVDYFVVNVSSPNTPNLRALQDKEPLSKILTALVALRQKFASGGSVSKPILLKIAPDLTTEQLNDVVEIVKETTIEGIVATNTTISREGLQTTKQKVEDIGAGGLSGKILFTHSTDILKHIHHKSNGTIPLIGVGGIDTEQKAEQKLASGATLVQVFTGFIFKGPNLVKAIAKLK